MRKGLNIIALALVALLALCCGGRGGGNKTDVEGGEIRDFPQLSMPTMIDEPEERMEYVALHYFDPFTRVPKDGEIVKYLCDSTDSLFAGRNLPSFVKDYLLKRYINSEGIVDRGALTAFLDKVIPREAASVKDRLGAGEEVQLLTRFSIVIDLVHGLRRFSIPDLGIKTNEGQIPAYIYEQNKANLWTARNGVSSSSASCRMRTSSASQPQP